MKYPAEWRIVSAAYFTLAGSSLIFGLSQAAASAWYLLVAWLFLATAIAWAWRPAVAARLTVAPVVVLALLFRYCSSLGDWLFLGGILAVSAFFIIKTLRSYPAPKPI
jgi:hypothetical protein